MVGGRYNIILINISVIVIYIKLIYSMFRKNNRVDIKQDIKKLAGIEVVIWRK